MRIAISVDKPDLDARVDPRFGRASFFLIVDSETMNYEVLENKQALDLPQGAGIQAAQNLLGGAPEVLLTGNCGPKAFRVLDAAGVKVCVGVKGTAQEAVTGFKEGRYTPADTANVEGHWV
jgi:predicted Fe-Mo cluster-binding NifX family protein